MKICDLSQCCIMLCCLVMSELITKHLTVARSVFTLSPILLMIMCRTKFSKETLRHRGVVEEVELKRVVIVPGPRPGLSELHMTHINRNDWNRGNNNSDAASSFHLAKSHPKFMLLQIVSKWFNFLPTKEQL